MRLLEFGQQVRALAASGGLAQDLRETTQILRGATRAVASGSAYSPLRQALVSFGFSAVVGVAFGLYPRVDRRASAPIDALRAD